MIITRLLEWITSTTDGDPFEPFTHCPSPSNGTSISGGLLLANVDP